MLLPEERGVAPRKRPRAVPTVIIILILAAVGIKIRFYFWEFFEHKELLSALPVYDSVADQAIPSSEGSSSTSISSTSVTNSKGSVSTSEPWSSDGLPHSDQNLSGHLPRPHRRPPFQSRTMREWQSYKTEEFTGANFSVNAKGGASEGYIFCSPATLRHDFTGPMIMTGDNELVWRGPAGVSTNVRLQDVDGVPHLTYWQTEDRMIQGHGYGAVYIMDSSYELRYRICPDINIVTNNDRQFRCYFDMHVSLITDRGTVIVTAYNVTQADLSPLGGPPLAWIYDAIFYEIDIKTQEIKFRWRSLDHIDDIPVSVSKMPFDRLGHGGRTRPFGEIKSSPWDYFHINSVQALDDGYLINSRSSWSIYKIFQNGSLDWRLQGEDGGDFHLDDDVYFSWQHDSRAVSVTEKTMEINLFNNGVSGFAMSDNASNTLSISLDLETRHVKLLRKFEDHSEFTRAMAMGNWQILPKGHMFVNYGYSGVLKEFDERGEVVFSAHFGRIAFHSFGASFSVFRYPNWNGMPRWAPKAVGETSEERNETTVWMSWNGATDYQFWTVYAGAKEDSLEVVDRYERAGFETQVVIGGMYDWIRVEAAKDSGPLRSSDVIRTTVEKPMNETDYEAIEAPPTWLDSDITESSSAAPKTETRPQSLQTPTISVRQAMQTALGLLYDPEDDYYI